MRDARELLTEYTIQIRLINAKLKAVVPIIAAPDNAIATVGAVKQIIATTITVVANAIPGPRFR